MSISNTSHPATLRILALTRSYPHTGLPRVGRWSHQLAHLVTGFAEVKVIAPVPYLPALIARFSPYNVVRHKGIPRQRWDGPVEVFHPQLLTGPGRWWRALEAASYIRAVLPTANRVRRDFPFDVIHAHSTYPDGVAAVVLGELYGVPVIVTERSRWLPWMDQHMLVRQQAVWAARRCSAHIAVSRVVRDQIGQVTGNLDKVRVIPSAIDGAVYSCMLSQWRNPNQILYVGKVNEATGFDVLLTALRELRRDRPIIRLKVIGEPLYGANRVGDDRLGQLARELGVAGCVEFVGGKSPAETAQLMCASQVVVLPSRRDSFGTVLIDALACGTPVVATRCGGPEDIVTPAAGRLVAPEDPITLASAIAGVLDNPQAYAPEALRECALAQFGVPVVAQQLAVQYAALVGPVIRMNLQAQFAAVAS